MHRDYEDNCLVVGPDGRADEYHRGMILYDWDGTSEQWEKVMKLHGLRSDLLESLYLKGGDYTELPDLPMLRSIQLDRGKAQTFMPKLDRAEADIVLAKYPDLESLRVWKPVLTNGVYVNDLQQYVNAWSPAKSARSEPEADKN